MRPTAREEINETLHDDILEISNSPVLNPLMVVMKEGKKVRIFIDVRKVNQYTIPDSDGTPPHPPPPIAGIIAEI
jgi:hypothetical protein